MSKTPLKQGTTTVRRLSPLDAARCLLLSQPSGHNRAYTLDRVDPDKRRGLSPVELARAEMPRRRRASSWLSLNNGRVVALATAGRRSQPESWEVRQLLLERGAEDSLPAMLERVSATAAIRGAKRVFLRIHQADPVAHSARLSGFFPILSETLFRGTPLKRSDKSPTSLRRKQPADEYRLFRLYNATTPAEVRSVVGMTLREWQASIETCQGRTREYVLERDGEVRGWLRCVRRSAAGLLSITIDPMAEEGIVPLVESGLGRLSGASTVYCLVPKYQAGLGRVLAYYGFDPVCEFTTLVNSTAVPVDQEGRVRATATSST